MAVYLLQECSDYTLGVWKMDEDESALLEKSGLSQMPTHVHHVRRQEYLAVRAMASALGIPAMDIAYKPSGKPYLSNSGPTISISHTKGYVAVLLSKHELAGVDVEHASDRVRRIRKKFMHPLEELALSNVCHPADETLGLLLHWCAKEAMFKAVPEDGVDFVQELRIDQFSSPQASGCFKGCFLRKDQSFQIDYLIRPDFVLTCSFSEGSK